MTEEKLHDLPVYRESAAFSDLEKLVIEYAAAMSKTPVEVSPELFASLRKHLSDEQLVELTGAIAWENYRARFNRPMSIAAQGFSQGAYCPLPERSQTL